MAARRPVPYTWWTWLTGLLAGDDHCWWKLWFKSHHKYKKRPDEMFDSVRWNAEHVALLRATAAELKAQGWDVYVENQNAFKIEGESTTLSGKPDIIAMRGDEILVVDVKTGKHRNAHWWQVAGYMQFIGYIVGDVVVAGKTVLGRIVYDDGDPPVEIAASHLMPQTVLLALRGLQGKEPEKVPSEGECKYCDVAECDSRVVPKPDAPPVPAGF